MNETSKLKNRITFILSIGWTKSNYIKDFIFSVSKPTLASDKDVQDLERQFSGQHGINIDRGRAKLIRRKNFVDFVREVVIINNENVL